MEAPLQPILVKGGEFDLREGVSRGHWSRPTQRHGDGAQSTGSWGEEGFITQNHDSPMVRVMGPNKIGIVSAVPLISWLLSLKTYSTECALCHPSSQMAF